MGGNASGGRRGAGDRSGGEGLAGCQTADLETLLVRGSHNEGEIFSEGGGGDMTDGEGGRGGVGGEEWYGGRRRGTGGRGIEKGKWHVERGGWGGDRGNGGGSETLPQRYRVVRP